MKDQDIEYKIIVGGTPTPVINKIYMKFEIDEEGDPAIFCGGTPTDMGRIAYFDRCGNLCLFKLPDKDIGLQKDERGRIKIL